MSKGARSLPRIDQFFAGPGARGDQWTNLVQVAEAWANNSGGRAKFDSALAEIAATEEFHAYPGPQLMTALRDRAAANDAQAAAVLARRITRAVLTRSFRQNSSVWDEHDDDESVAADALPPTMGQAKAHRPYFEVLIVTGTPAAR
jgi:arginine decarboxylase